ncbi:hypothetical protein T492DRAFT_844558 [Pavlovales sp. CCMP2436]|nr:hypothetical protein T492DRAFT_844558 [Pavlovales sp. CCMP2436]
MPTIEAAQPLLPAVADGEATAREAAGDCLVLQPLLLTDDGAASGVATPPPPVPAPRSNGQQLRALLRKQWQLKRRSPGTALCEVLLPAILCLTVVLGARLAERESSPARAYVPDGLLAALETLEPQPEPDPKSDPESYPSPSPSPKHYNPSVG